MKISSIESNGWFHEFASLCLVTLDGKEVEGFVFADDDAVEGKVTYFDSEGQMVTERGVVTITFPEAKAKVFEVQHEDFVALASEDEPKEKSIKK